MPRVKVSIAKESELALVDTGAEISVIQENLWRRCQPPAMKLERTGERPHSATGDVLEVKGLSDVTVMIGGTQFTHKFRVVSNVDSPMILGWDFMLAHNVSVDPAARELKIGEQSVQLAVRERKPPGICRVTTTEERIVPPNSEVLVPGRLIHNEGRPLDLFDGVLEPRGGNNVLVARIVATATEESIPVRIMNVSSEPLLVRKGKLVGDFHCVEPTVGPMMRSNYELLEEYQPAEEASPVPTGDETEDVREGSDLPPVDLSGCELTEEQLEKLKDLLRKNADVFSKTPEDRGLTDLVSHKINTGDARPIKQPPRRVPFHLRDEMQRQVDDMLRDGVIEPCDGPWSSPVVLVRKKSGDFRFCVDYRKLNGVTVPDAHNLPRLDDTLAGMAGATVFTTLDLTSGYWQVPVDTEDRDKTGFSVGPNLYRFKVLPFGLCNAPPLFARLIELVFAGMDWRVISTYLDDLFVYTKTFEEHLEALEEVFRRLRKANLKLKPSKCKIAQPRTINLGHEVSKDGIRPDPENIAKVVNWPVPRKEKDVRSFLGLASFYRRYVQNFAQIATPLNRLLEKDSPFVWTEACQSSFEELKQRLTSPPILGHPVWGEPFIVSTDASDESVGSVLSQQQEGVEKVIAYASKSLNKTERNWATYDKEFWAIVWALRHFYVYLWGSSFTVYTDHRPLTHQAKVKFENEPSGRRSRWAIELGSHNEMEIKYRPGPKNGAADALSRRPLESENTEAVRSIGVQVTVTRNVAVQVDMDMDFEVNQQTEQLPEKGEEKCQNAEKTAVKEKPVPKPRKSVVKSGTPMVQGANGELKSEQKSAAVRQIVGPMVGATLTDQAVEENSRSARLAHVLDWVSTKAVSVIQGVHSTTLGQSEYDAGTNDSIEAEQEADPVISQVRHWVVNKAKPEWLAMKHEGRDLKTYWRKFDELSLQKGVLCHACYIPKRKKTVQRQVLPAGLRLSAIQDLHAGVVAGHLGRNKTLKKVRDRFFWPGVYQDVYEFCRTCPRCVARQGPVPGMQAPMESIKSTRPLELVATDITELPVTPRGNRYALVIEDHFTKYCNIYAMRDQTAGTVANLLFREYVREHGVPESYHSDQGRQFEAEVCQELCVLLGIYKSRTTPYHPQGNGMVERFNKTLKNMIAKVTREHGKDWDLQLGPVALAYNSSVHESTNYSPFYLMHGREPRIPADVVYGTPTPGYWNKVSHYAKDVYHGLKTAFEDVQQNLSLAQRRQRKVHDKWARHHPYSAGDKVWLLTMVSKHRHRKLALPWEGPYVVKKRLQNADGMPGVVYRIEHEVTRKRQVVHHNRLKPYAAPRIPTPLRPDMGEAAEEVEVRERRPNLFQRQLDLVPVAPRMPGGRVAPAAQVPDEVPEIDDAAVAEAPEVDLGMQELPLPVAERPGVVQTPPRPATPATTPGQATPIPRTPRPITPATPRSPAAPVQTPQPLTPVAPVRTRAGRVSRLPERFRDFLVEVDEVTCPPLRLYEFPGGF